MESDKERNSENAWNIIDTYFRDNPQCLVRHHTESFNDFFQQEIFQMFRETNPIRIVSRKDADLNDYRCQCNIYLGGKDGSRIYFGKPMIYDDDRSHYMFPNEARLRNMTYAMTVHYDIEVEYIRLLEPGEEIQPILKGGGGAINEYDDEYDDDTSSSESDAETNENKRLNMKATYESFRGISRNGGDGLKGDGLNGGAPKAAFKKTKNPIKRKHLTGKLLAEIRELTEKSLVAPNMQVHTEIIENIYLGRFPIMVQSEFCVLNGLPREARFQMGECRNDYGGYFIIDGKERVILPQEQFADNIMYVQDVHDEHFLYSAVIRSVSENVAKPVRTLSIKVVAPNKTRSYENIVVNIPNVRKPVPLFIVFRALGIMSDRDIIQTCLLDMETYEDLIDHFAPSVHEAGGIMTQLAALQYIAVLTKAKTMIRVHEILANYLLPHVGETNYIEKAYFLGHMVFQLVKVWAGKQAPTNRDNFKFKRIETAGVLISQLFREYLNIQNGKVRLGFDRILNGNKPLYENNLQQLIRDHYVQIFAENRDVDAGFRRAFKGDWGSAAHTKRIGVVQVLDRLSYFSAMNHLRKTVLYLDSGVKLVGPRLLHASQWGYFDPIDSPDGANIGLYKHLTVSAYITKGMSREPLVQWLYENPKIRFHKLTDCVPGILAKMTKVFVNGHWAGSVENPIECVREIKLYRRNALLPIYTSASFENDQNAIFIYCDKGRLTRPLFYFDENLGKFSFENPAFLSVLKKEKDNAMTWQNLIAGFNPKLLPSFHCDDMKIYKLHELYDVDAKETNPAKYDRFLKNKAVIDYVDTNESESTLIAMNMSSFPGNYTHMEIHESFAFSMLCNMINYLENNPVNRDNFSCGQSKQAVSMYSTNHHVRLDKAAVVLNYGQKPFVKSRYLEYVNRGENPYGENAIVAIMCYTGYNVEDAILVNEGALKRGLFQTTYYSTYETHEEKKTNGDSISEKLFGNIENLLKNDVAVNGMRMDYEYDALDEYGLIREGTEIHERKVLIGMTSRTSGIETRFDESKTTKKGQLGIVDRAFMTEGEEGQRIAKIRVREIRVPGHGDKMASRAGQKGTVGLVIREEDMPFTKDGLRPDLIINPHAIPTRMTIGQFVECIAAKVSALFGGYADCTPFTNNATANIGAYGEMLTSLGFHSSGNQIMYNGMTGEQLQSQIFIGPTYYMRLKHMVKDKINYRTTGPRTALTRQPVSGRANDGGLRIGEMERDAVIAHGATNFLTESMMERGDKYYMAVCNTTGMTAIYHPAKDLFMSPMADGPIQFTSAMNDAATNIETGMNVVKITRFGRSFSVICIPYSLKLLIQELQCANVQMRIITEDNIRHFDDLGFQKETEKGNEEEDPQKTRTKRMDWKEIVLQNKKTIQENARKRENPIPENETPRSAEYADYYQSPAYAEGSPVYADYYQSPAYAEGSPAYASNQSPREPYAKGMYVGLVSENDQPWLPRENKTIWKIVDISDENGLITIENMNSSAEMGAEDKLKIVEAQQLYHIHERDLTPEAYMMGQSPNSPVGLQQGMKVMYASEMWQIEDVNQSQNMASIRNLASNELRVVMINDITPINEGMNEGMNGGSLNGGSLNGGSLNGGSLNGFHGGASGQGPIHFAPTIVVGDSNHVQDPLLNAMPAMQGGTQNSFANTDFKNSPVGNYKKGGESEKDGGNDKKEEEKEKKEEKNDNPFLNFFNIKKLGV